MVSIKSVTAGKLLKEFIQGYDAEPFGEQGLVIVKQLLDIAFPDKEVNKIIESEELRILLHNAVTQYEFRKRPFFLAFTSFLLDTSPDAIKKMSGSQLKQELATLLEGDRPLPTFGIERAEYDLSGNPESAVLVKNALEGALISTTTSLFTYLLIENEGRAGRLFRDLDSQIRKLAENLKLINPFVIFLKALVDYKWKNVSLNGILPTAIEIDIEDIIHFFYQKPSDYLTRMSENYLNNLKRDGYDPIISIIDSCQIKASNNDSNFTLETFSERTQFSKIKDKILKDLEKIQSRVIGQKKINSKEFESLKDSLDKEWGRLEKEIRKEFQNFEKSIISSLRQTPPIFKYVKAGEDWILSPYSDMESIMKKRLQLEVAFKESSLKKDQKALEVFVELGGIEFAMENIIAHYFYERLPSRLIKLLEMPAKEQKIKILKFLQEKRYNEGFEAISDFLIPYSNAIISQLLAITLDIMKTQYFSTNPPILIYEEDIQNIKFIKLLNVPKEFFDDILPQKYIGNEYFIFQVHDDNIEIGLNLKSLNGKGTALFELLVSSTAYEDAEIYKNSRRVLGNFSGYVYSTAIGNMQVCPPPLKLVDDVFMK
ncbi:MAG: hypothetical protein EAX86_05610 [Candidatus Heimdallarchaeota archaeon]|nr:hypothetical protein [Candidatus Heimdallarchaeota archaeon]